MDQFVILSRHKLGRRVPEEFSHSVDVIFTQADFEMPVVERIIDFITPIRHMSEVFVETKPPLTRHWFTSEADADAFREMCVSELGLPCADAVAEQLDKAAPVSLIGVR